ncbi:pilus assembly protein PilP [Neisseria sp. WLZKY-1]|jgi:hypothetical protein|uniref:pilus assembly protein PilP n=1 Tax=Neisseria sp. WLZKY-1 TaxID=3390377 RepID=UPI00397BB5DC
MMKKIILLSAFLCLSACDDEPEDLRVWVDATKKEAEKKVKPVEIPIGVPALTYTPAIQPVLDAFNSKRLSTNQKGVNAPDLNRPKEVLEAFNLDSIKYVGSFKKAGTTSAFVEVEGHVYTVVPGNYIGQNYGKVTKIQDDAILITELVEDANGNWTFRPAELILSSSEKTGN